jgi:hypothetical protein
MKIRGGGTIRQDTKKKQLTPRAGPLVDDVCLGAGCPAGVGVGVPISATHDGTLLGTGTRDVLPSRNVLSCKTEADVVRLIVHVHTSF